MPLLTTEQVDGVIRNLVQSFFERAGLAGMSYRDAAPLVGVTYQTLNNWARGTMPGDLHTLLALMWAKARLDELSDEEVTAMQNNQAARREWVRQTVEAGR
jgi:transposase